MKETKPKTFVFVLMPFSEEFNDIYELGIKAACIDAGAYCERVDEQIFVENILDRVYNQIAKADVIISEMTGRNPNVFYETGYAHALNKRVILLTNNADDIPFDLKHYPHIIYGGKISFLKSQLEARVRWCIENPQDNLKSVDLTLQFFVNGIELKGNPLIETPVELRRRPPSGLFREIVDLRLDIHNPTTKTANPEYFDVALEMPRAILIEPSYTGIRSDPSQLLDERHLYNLQTADYIFPDGWHNFVIPLKFPKREILDEPVEFTARLYTEFGPVDYPFQIKFYRRERRA